MDELRKQLREYKYLYSNLSDAVFILDYRGVFLMVSKKLEELTGHKEKDFLNSNVFNVDFIPKKFFGIVKKIL